MKLINKDCLDKQLLNKLPIFDSIITDPPYNISKKNNFHQMKIGNRKGIDFGEWDKGFNIIEWIKPYYQKLKNGGNILIFCSYLYVSDIINELKKLGAEIKNLISIVKNNPMPRNIKRLYVNDTEYCLWATKGKGWTFNYMDKGYLRPRIISNVVAGKEKTNHPTQKSLFVMKELIKVHTNENDLIIDPFMGSGTTGLAAKELNRKFIGVELNNEYFEIAKKRLNYDKN